MGKTEERPASKPAFDPKRAAKRALDLAIAAEAGLLLLPILGVTALLVKLESPGPVFCWRNRLGKGGKPFWMPKFRSMFCDADQRLEALLQSDPALEREYHRYRKLHSDPRVTRIGRLLRRFSLDELPQLWNVLRGEMSVVGPRPYEAAEVAAMDGHLGTILRVRPGLTGLWQVSGRNKLGFDERLVLDARYVRNWSLALDLSILARTVPVVLRGDGAC